MACSMSEYHERIRAWSQELSIREDSRYLRDVCRQVELGLVVPTEESKNIGHYFPKFPGILLLFFLWWWTSMFSTCSTTERQTGLTNWPSLWTHSEDRGSDQPQSSCKWPLLRSLCTTDQPPSIKIAHPTCACLGSQSAWLWQHRSVRLSCQHWQPNRWLNKTMQQVKNPIRGGHSALIPETWEKKTIHFSVSTCWREQGRRLGKFNRKFLKVKTSYQSSVEILIFIIERRIHICI